MSLLDEDVTARKLDPGCRSIAVEDVVGWVDFNGLREEVDRLVKLTRRKRFVSFGLKANHSITFSMHEWTDTLSSLSAIGRCEVAKEIEKMQHFIVNNILDASIDRSSIAQNISQSIIVGLSMACHMFSDVGMGGIGKMDR